MTTFVYKIFHLILIVILSTPTSTLTQDIDAPDTNNKNCFGGIMSYEKTPGVEFKVPPSQILVASSDQAVTPDCAALCRQSNSCLAFTNEYKSGRCLSFERDSVGRRELLRPHVGTNFFEEVCYRGVSDYSNICGNRIWAFERIASAFLEGFDEKEDKNVASKVDCERLCLTEKSFTCRSCEYDEIRHSCRLSREDRRTQPLAFKLSPASSTDYLENQCVKPIPTCQYEVKSGVSVISLDDLQFAHNSNECEKTCDKTSLFTCWAFAFDNRQSRCYLSGDDTTGPSDRTSLLPVRPGLVYGERKCISDGCTNGIMTFEKISVHMLRNAVPEPILVNTVGQGITLDCLQGCKDLGPQCPAMTVDYATNRCFRLDRNSQGRDGDVIPYNTHSYFEQTCLRVPNQACHGKAWSFERVVHHELLGFDDRVVYATQSRRECQEACLREAGFICRSADYDYDTTECRLSKEDRRTRPGAFGSTTRNVDYLENQCLGVDLNCRLEKQEYATPILVEFIQAEIRNEDDCLGACASFQGFTCRSVGFRPNQGECLISNDDQTSAHGAFAEHHPETILYERTCLMSRAGGFPSPLPSATSFYPSSSGSDDNLLPTPQASSSYLGGRCPSSTQGFIEYEKTTGYVLKVDLMSTLVSDDDRRGITKECKDLCDLELDCLAFNIDYNSSECVALRRDSTLNRHDLEVSVATGYFEPVCFKTRACGRLWTFERHLNKDMRGQARDTIQGITKAECEERCLLEIRFPCRAAIYNHVSSECRLSTEDRFSLPDAFVDTKDMDYLENQCSNVLTSRQASTCQYNVMARDKVLSFVDRVVQTSSESECQRVCDTELQFVCRSYSFTGTQAKQAARSPECYLSADTRTSIGAQLQDYPGANYVERTCPQTFPGPIPSGKVPVLPLYPKPPGPSLPYPSSGYPPPGGPGSYPSPSGIVPGGIYPPGPSGSGQYSKASGVPPPPPPPSMPYPPPPSYGGKQSSGYYPSQSIAPGMNYPGQSTGPGMNYPGQSTGQLYPGTKYQQYPSGSPSIGSYPGQYPAQSIGQPSYPSLSPSKTLYPGQMLYPGQQQQPSYSASGVQYYDQNGQYPPPPIYSGSIPVAATCDYGTDAIFEKTMGFAVRPPGRMEPLPASVTSQHIVTDCLKACSQDGARCQAFMIQYPFSPSTTPCLSLDRGLGPERTQLLPRGDTAYFEKLCLKEAKGCGKMWTFERVVGFQLDGSYEKELRNVFRKEDCEEACLAETTMPCRSAIYIYSQQTCRMTSETRRTKPESLRFVGNDVDYLENQCAPEPSECEYTDLPSKFNPFTDRLAVRILTFDECKKTCEQEQEFVCRSVSFDNQNNDCYMSAEDRFSTPAGPNIMIDRAGFEYAEKGGCGQVKVDCTQTEMLVTLRFGAPFNGRIYAKGNPQLCFIPGNSQSQVTMNIPIGTQCGTAEEGRYANEIVVQQHPVIMTDHDRTYRIVCSFDMTDKTLTFSSGGGGAIDVTYGDGESWARRGVYDDGAMGPGSKGNVLPRHGGPPPLISNTAPTPNVRLRITDRTGQDVTSVSLGDELYFKIEPDPYSAFGVFAKNLVARSEFLDYLPLLDNNGCPTDPNIFPGLEMERGTKALVAPFKAFRFASTGRVNFEIQIHFCQDACQQGRCQYGNTFGRRKRNVAERRSVANETMDAMNGRSGNTKATTNKTTGIPITTTTSTNKMSTTSPTIAPKTSSVTRTTKTFHNSQREENNASEKFVTRSDDVPVRSGSGTENRSVSAEVTGRTYFRPEEQEPFNSNPHAPAVDDQMQVPLIHSIPFEDDAHFALPDDENLEPTDTQMQQTSLTDTFLYGFSSAYDDGSSNWNGRDPWSPPPSEDPPVIPETHSEFNKPSTNVAEANRFQLPTDRQHDIPETTMTPLAQLSKTTPTTSTTTEKDIPSEIPLRLSLTVSGETEAERKNHPVTVNEGSPLHSNQFEDSARNVHPDVQQVLADMVCTPKSTVIAITICVILVHAGVACGITLWYRRRQKKAAAAAKEASMTDTNQSPAELPTTTAQTMFYRPAGGLTFRSVDLCNRYPSTLRPSLPMHPSQWDPLESSSDSLELPESSQHC